METWALTVFPSVQVFMRRLLSRPDYEPVPGNAAASRAHVALVLRRTAVPVNERLFLRHRKLIHHYPHTPW